MDKEKSTYKHLLLPKLLVALLLICASHSLAQTAAKPEEQPLTVEFTPDGGFYNDTITVQLLSPGAAIYFTTDGSKPSETASLKYGTPLRFKKTTVVRAVAVRGGKKSTVFSATFFIKEPESTFPIVSVSIAPSMLFDPSQGLFMKGTNAVDTLWQLPGANFWSRKETGANFEIFTPDGKYAWRNYAGLRLFGGMSRLFPQKSISIIARHAYGDNRILYPIFGKSGLKKFKYLVLRNSGSDFGRSHFRDALITNLVKDWDLDVQDYQPAHVYINGYYWGIYNFREKVNRYFIAGHYDVHKDSIDLIEHRLTKRTGSTKHYQRLLGFLSKNSLANAANFAWAASQMEVNNFLDYQIAQIYCDNQDAGGNIKYWRPKTENGRWRWILYDTDYGFGLNDPKAYRHNSLKFHTATDGPNWPNPPWSTFILRKLLENKDFERQFINRFADRLNHDLDSTRVLSKIEKFYMALLPEMPRHLERWKQSKKTWERDVATLRTFARMRPAYMRQFLMEKFNTGGLRPVELDIAAGGHVVLNENFTVKDTFVGQYFEKVPIRLKAVPNLGYRFVEWRGQEIQSSSPELVLQLAQPSYRIEAVFEKFEHPLAGKIVINEISCNNKQSGDWVEIYNNTRDRVNLKGWILTDRKNEFQFPAYTLPPKGYVIVCQDSADFLKVHPTAQSVIGGLSFGLNKRHETIQLFSPEAAAVDSIGYELEPMDSVFALNLLLPSLDNGNPGNWELVPGNGTPGSANSYYLTSKIQSERELWMQIGGGFALLILGIFVISVRAKRKDRRSFGT